MSGKCPRILGPPDRPGEGRGEGGCETPWLPYSTFTRGGQGTVHLGRTRRCHGSCGSSGRARHIKTKNRDPLLSNRNAQIKIPGKQKKPCLAARSTGHLVLQRTAFEDSSAGQQASYKTGQRHGQAEDTEPQQRSAGSCIPTPCVTQAPSTLTRCAPCKMCLTAAGAPPWCGSRRTQGTPSRVDRRQNLAKGAGDSPVRQAHGRRSTGRLDTRPQSACPRRSIRRKNNSDSPDRQNTFRRHPC